MYFCISMEEPMNNGERYANSLMMHRGALLDLLELIPADKGHFSPWDGGRNFLDLCDHLSNSSSYMVAAMSGQAPEQHEPSPDLAAAKERLSTNLHSVRKSLSALTDEQLSSIVEVFGGQKMPVWALAGFMIEHEAHHKGQIWVMARMIGVQPPMFAKR
jgi:uncharacterized damage-inducible protein DinB